MTTTPKPSPEETGQRLLSETHTEVFVDLQVNTNALTTIVWRDPDDPEVVYVSWCDGPRSDTERSDLDLAATIAQVLHDYQESASV